MNTFIKKTIISFGVLATLPGGLAIPAYGADITPASISQTHVQGGAFTKKKYGIKGDWQIIQKDGQTILRLSDDFKTKKGPDLKIFLSPKSVAAVSGKTATQGSVLISELNSNKGGQDYVIPANVNLANFSSVLIHCEEFSVLWGGGDL